MKKIDTDRIQAIADTIMPNFIPKDAQATEFSFHFTLPPAQNFHVQYKKDKQGNWVFSGYEAISSPPSP